MIIAIFPHKEKKESIDLAKKTIAFFQKQSIEVVTEEEFSKILNCRSLSSVNFNNIEFLIAIGGDGSILHLAQKYITRQKPIVGINLGTIGFLSDIPVSDLEGCLQDLVEKKYAVENRIIIESVCNKNTCFKAINEFIIHRGQNPRIIELAITIDGKYCNTFAGDGIIVATPNGSTAYSLAAGGPILTPQLDAFVMTPVCAHTISNRPIVLTTSQEIEIQYVSQNEHPIEIRGDGICFTDMQTDDKVSFKKSKDSFKLIKLHRHDYFSTLKSKLGWSGKLPY